MAATNLVPGPNATEMAIHSGFLQAGWPGFIAGGAAFVVPAFLISLALAAALAGVNEVVVLRAARPGSAPSSPIPQSP